MVYKRKGANPVKNKKLKSHPLKTRFVTGVNTPLGNRRIKGCGDRLSRELLECHTVDQMIDYAHERGVDCRQYKKSKLHLGILRMTIGNRLRAYLRRVEAQELEAVAGGDQSTVVA
jgi:hypothetical protein